MSAQRVVLLIEDNKQLMEANRRALAKADYHIEMALNLAEARACLAKCNPDAIVLDIMLPDGNGLDFITEIREVTTAPVLLLTALDEKSDRLNGLRAGGNDYISKPYDIDELRERIAAFIRRDTLIEVRRPAERISWGPLLLDTIAQQGFLDGKDLSFTPKEFGLLLVLVRNGNKELSAKKLYETVWRQPDNDDIRAVKAHISNLRKKLEGSSFTITVTRNEGYRFEEDTL